MGLSKDSMGVNAVDLGLVIRKNQKTDKVVALGGNPNVGKSTVFNELTGLRQHTGNWTGKTVTNAQGYCNYHQHGYVVVDLPGCYSLMAHSTEEEVARDFICFGGADAVIIVCDATCMERSLNLVLQTMEITSQVVVCVNLMDEAEKKKIQINLSALAERLGVPVVGTSARSRKGLDQLMDAVTQITENPYQRKFTIHYPDYLEAAISKLEPCVDQVSEEGLDSRWLSLMLLQWDHSMHGFIEQNLKYNFLSEESVTKQLKEVKEDFEHQGITERQIKDDIVTAIVHTAERLCEDTIRYERETYKNNDIDKILTGRWTAFPIMIVALLIVFWITIVGANYPSQALSTFFFWIEGKLLLFFKWLHAPKFLYEMLILGVYRVLAWVVSVMLPPMAIFFPMFTLLEDVGFLPRIAFNLDKCFKKCCACGKQALTMCIE